MSQMNANVFNNGDPFQDHNVIGFDPRGTPSSKRSVDVLPKTEPIRGIETKEKVEKPTNIGSLKNRDEI